VHAADANGPVPGSPLTVPASAVKPGDYLPPQRCLDPSAWQDSGFRIGARPEDVCRDHPLAAGHVLLFGPLGVLDFLRNRDVVFVVRPAPAGVLVPRQATFALLIVSALLTICRRRLSWACRFRHAM